MNLSHVRIDVWRQNDLWAGYAIDQRRKRVASIVARTRLGFIVKARRRVGWRTPVTFLWDAR